MKKKKILFVMLNLYNGGAERSLVNLFNEMDYTKYDVNLLLFQKKGMFLKQVPSQVNIISTPKDLYLLYNKPKLRDFKKIENIKLIFYRYFCTLLTNILYRNKIPRVRKQIRWKKFYKDKLNQLNGDYDIAISYLENEPTRYVIDKVCASKKYVWFHNDYKSLGLNKKYDEYYYEKADKIVTISEKCLKVLNDVFPQNKDKNIFIPNLSSTNMIKKMAETACEYKYNQDVFRIISIGRLSMQKGFDIAVETARILKENNINYQWFIIGDGTMKKEIQNKINKYNLKNIFCLIGTTDNPYPYIRSANILVQSSRSEGKSMVLDEAKILCKPFVVTKYPTVYDQANEDIAVLVDITPESIANGIIELYNDQEKLKKLENNLKKCNYSNEREIEKYYRLFDE